MDMISQGAQHRALARAGVADNQRQIPLARDMRNAARCSSPSPRSRKAAILRRCADAVPARRGQALGRALHPLLGREHRPRGEPLATAASSPSRTISAEASTFASTRANCSAPSVCRSINAPGPGA